VESKVSYAQNAEDIRVWRAFHMRQDPPLERGDGFTYVDVGANEARHLSITASLYDLGWRGLLIEADPALARDLRTLRPSDAVVECAASDSDGTLTFNTVPGTGLGTLNTGEAQAAARRGVRVPGEHEARDDDHADADTGAERPPDSLHGHRRRPPCRPT
jgi:hypothetical protein